MSDFLRAWGPLIATALVAVSGGSVGGAVYKQSEVDARDEKLEMIREHIADLRESRTLAWKRTGELQASLDRLREECQQ